MTHDLLKHSIERLWSLPSVKNRRRWPFLFVPKQLKGATHIERDADYLCYQTGALTQIIGILVLLVLLIDALGGFGWIVDPQALAAKKVSFVVGWMGIMGKVAPLLAVLCYLRLRLTIDLRTAQIPFLVSKAFFRGKSRREWIEYSSLTRVSKSLSDSHPAVIRWRINEHV